MSYREAMHWFLYMKKHGGIGPTRTNYLLATIATMTNNAHGGKAELSDFLPALPAAEPEVISDAEQMMRFWS